MKRILALFCMTWIALLPSVGMAQIDGQFVKPRTGKFILKNATVVTVTKGTLSNASVLLENGKIIGVGASLPTEGAEVIDCSGLFILE